MGYLERRFGALTHAPTMDTNKEHKYTSDKEHVGQLGPTHTVPAIPPPKRNMTKKKTNDKRGAPGTSWSGQEVKWRGTLARDDGVVTVGICAMDKKV